jgi:hypothetical protein
MLKGISLSDSELLSKIWINILNLMCDAINEKDERYKYASELMDKDGCK